MKTLNLILFLFFNTFLIHSQNILVINKAHNHPDGMEYVLLSPTGKVVKDLKGITLSSGILDGYISAKEGDNFGYIDAATGEWAIKLTQNGIKNNLGFHNGWAVVIFENGQSMVIDKKGKIVLENLKGEVGNFENDVAISVATNENGTSQYGIYDKTGKLVVPFSEDLIEPFSNGLALKIDTKTGTAGYIDAKGNWAIKPQWKSAFSFSNGVAFVSLEGEDDPTYGLIDTKGKLIIDYKIKVFDPFNNGLARVGLAGKTPDDDFSWNFIDKTGKFLFDKHLTEKPEEISEGKRMIWDKAGEKVGFINAANKTIIPTKLPFLMSCDVYERVFQGFKEGLFPTADGYIDTTGKIVISVPNKGKMCTAKPCENGLVVFSVYNNDKDNKYRNYVADKTGKILWQSVDNEVYACFPAGAYVSMADGSRKKIEDIKTGDKVIDLNNTPSVVEAVDIHEGNFTIGAMQFNMPEKVDFVSNTNIKSTVLLEATLNHPLSIRGKKVAFGDVKMGDKVLQLVQNQLIENTVQGINLNYKIVNKVYNLRIKGTGYFVNGYGVLMK